MRLLDKGIELLKHRRHLSHKGFISKDHTALNTGKGINHVLQAVTITHPWMFFFGPGRSLRVGPPVWWYWGWPCPGLKCLRRPGSGNLSAQIVDGKSPTVDNATVKFIKRADEFILVHKASYGQLF